MSRRRWNACPTSFDRLSVVVRNNMYHNALSAIQMMANVPTSQLWKVVAPAFGAMDFRFYGQDAIESGSKFPLTTAHSTTDSSYPGTSHAVSFATAEWDHVKYLMSVCTILANGRDMRERVDLEDTFIFIKMNHNLPVLKAFFSLDLPVIHATWDALIDETSIANEWHAFNALAKIGFDTHQGAWNSERLAKLFWHIVRGGYEHTGSTFDRLLSTGTLMLLHAEAINITLCDIAEALDSDMMRRFVDAGARFQFTASNVDTLTIPNWKDNAHCAHLLLMAGLNVDVELRKCPETAVPFDDSFLEERDMPDVGHYRFVDWLWANSCPKMYEVLIVHSKLAEVRITIPGIVMAAHSGLAQLKHYLDLRDNDPCINRKTMMELAMSAAAYRGDAHAIQSLGAANVNPNTPFLSQMRRPLIVAARKPQIESLGVLIDLNADTPIFTERGLFATIYGDHDVREWYAYDLVKYLTGQGVIKHFTIRELMVVLRHQPIDEELIDRILTSMPKAMNLDSTNLIHIAIEQSVGLSAIKFLQARGIPINSSPCPRTGNTMLHNAILHSPWGRDYYQDAKQVIFYLMNNGADCSKEWGGPTILELLFDRFDWPLCDRLATCRSFLDHDAQINGPRTRLDNTEATSILTSLLKEEAPNTAILQLIEMGADIHSGGYGDEPATPLQMAAKMGRYEIVRELILRGADINASPGKDGRTVLQYACEHEHSHVSLGFVQYLLDQGAKVNDPSLDTHTTALHCAIRSGLMSVFCLLLDFNADINAVQHLYYSVPQLRNPLDIAASWGRLDMVDILIQKGARSYKQGKTPYDGAIRCATRIGYHAIARMLEDHFEKEVGKGNMTEHAESQVVEIIDDENTGPGHNYDSAGELRDYW
ncbi:ankyrin repeat-containing domain protein [Nemania sp. FL0916]|nr:ankyrin repeat-containing domain protein [Nemania sp. FL0916]